MRIPPASTNLAPSLSDLAYHAVTPIWQPPSLLLNHGKSPLSCYGNWLFDLCFFINNNRLRSFRLLQTKRFPLTRPISLPPPCDRLVPLRWPTRRLPRYSSVTHLSLRPDVSNIRKPGCLRVRACRRHQTHNLFVTVASSRFFVRLSSDFPWMARVHDSVSLI